MKANGAEILANQLRLHVLNMTHKAGSSHVGTCLSMIELLAILYTRILRVDPAYPDWPDRDRFILSKGHGAAALYAVLAERGFFPIEWLESFCLNGSRLSGHVTHRGVPGVEFSTGSLGHGLSVATGMALVAKRERKNHRVFVLLSDGECDEGSTWEPVLFAGHHRLDNLVAIVDYNHIQSLGTIKEVLDLEPFAEKWRSWNWAVREIDGHDCNAIEAVLQDIPFEADRPSCVIAHTVKGRGVSFMQNKILWHYRSPQGNEYDAAIKEVEMTGLSFAGNGRETE